MDRFDAEMTSIEQRERQSLRELRIIATVRSVGASTRTEGSSMTDAEVEVLAGCFEGVETRRTRSAGSGRILWSVERNHRIFQ